MFSFVFYDMDHLNFKMPRQTWFLPKMKITLHIKDYFYSRKKNKSGNDNEMNCVSQTKTLLIFNIDMYPSGDYVC
jgi:hypothetical protein